MMGFASLYPSYGGCSFAISRRYRPRFAPAFALLKNRRLRALELEFQELEFLDKVSAVRGFYSCPGIPI
jgi:hypothetical protein